MTLPTHQPLVGFDIDHHFDVVGITFCVLVM